MKRTPTLANIKRGESYDIYIGRANGWLNLPESKWKNPFPLKKESERMKILNQHWEYMKTRPDLIEALGELEGKVLGCYCFSSIKNEGKVCHGHNLIKLFEKYVNGEVGSCM